MALPPSDSRQSRDIDVVFQQRSIPFENQDLLTISMSDIREGVFFALTTTVTKMFVNGSTTFPLMLTIIVRELHG